MAKARTPAQRAASKRNLAKARASRSRKASSAANALTFGSKKIPASKRLATKKIPTISKTVQRQATVAINKYKISRLTPTRTSTLVSSNSKLPSLGSAKAAKARAFAKKAKGTSAPNKGSIAAKKALVNRKK